MNRAIKVPLEIRQALEEGAALAISISGGKDSQALLNSVTSYHRAHGFTGELFAIHADLGFAEWEETPAFVEHICEAVDIPLVIVRHRSGGLVERMEERLETLEIQYLIQDESDRKRKPFWPSAAARYCTSDTKRGPINKHLRRYDHIISAEGIRAEESRARAKKPCWQPRKAIVTKKRRALTWNPLIDWTEDDVWEACGTSSDELEHRRWLYAEGHEEQALSGCNVHPAYVYGNKRLSCALCLLACKSDVLNGIRHHPDLGDYMADMEARSGFMFRPDFSITEAIKTMRAAA